MISIGHRVKEIRIHEDKEYRVLYVAKFEETIYVLHAFVKKTEQTSKRDLGLAKQRYSEMLFKEI